MFHSQGNISLWEGVLVLKGLNYREQLTKGSTELATVYLGRCVLFEIDLGGSGVCLELKAQQDTCPFTVLRDLYALKAN